MRTCLLVTLPVILPCPPLSIQRENRLVDMSEDVSPCHSICNSTMSSPVDPKRKQVPFLRKISSTYYYWQPLKFYITNVNRIVFFLKLQVFFNKQDMLRAPPPQKKNESIVLNASSK